MKKYILTLCLFSSFFSGYAQFDEMFYQPRKEWRQHGLPAYEELWIVNDSDSIHAVWCMPEKEPIAVVLFCHGNYGNISYHDGAITSLVEEGFAVLAWDYPGFGLSPGAPTHAGIAQTGQTVFDHLLSGIGLQGLPLVVFGSSIGSQVATKLTRDNREKISLLILDSGMSSFTEMALIFAPEDAHPMIRQYLSFPYASQEDVRHISGVPLLVMHSREDKIVPFKQGEAVFENAIDPKRFLEYSGEHVTALFVERQKIIALIREMLGTDNP